MLLKFFSSLFVFFMLFPVHAQVEEVSQYRGKINLTALHGNYNLVSWLKADKGSTTFSETFSNVESWQFFTNGTLTRAQEGTFQANAQFTVSDNILSIQWNKKYREAYEILSCTEASLVIASKNIQSKYQEILILKKE